MGIVGDLAESLETQTHYEAMGVAGVLVLKTRARSNRASLLLRLCQHFAGGRRFAFRACTVLDRQPAIAGAAQQAATVLPSLLDQDRQRREIRWCPSRASLTVLISFIRRSRMSVGGWSVSTRSTGGDDSSSSRRNSREVAFSTQSQTCQPGAKVSALISRPRAPRRARTRRGRGRRGPAWRRR